MSFCILKAWSGGLLMEDRRFNSKIPALERARELMAKAECDGMHLFLMDGYGAIIEYDSWVRQPHGGWSHEFSRIMDSDIR